MDCPLRFLILTVSDRCSRGESVDKSGPSLAERILKDGLGTVMEVKCIPDDQQRIEVELVAGSEYCDVILTTGGTGFSIRDVTPEATKAVIQREVPSFSLAMTLEGLSKTKHAILSRAVCGIRGRCLIINLPGSVKGSVECFEAVSPTLEHAVKLLRGSDVSADHGEKNSSEHKSKVLVGDVASRPRESLWPMLSMDEAYKVIEENIPGPSIETLTLSCDLVGRVVGENMMCAEPLPPFRASIKDGYAVLSQDGPGVRRVKRAVTAGMSPDMEKLEPGEVARVSTGGPIPPNADAVVQVEDTKLVKGNSSGEEIEVEILSAPKIGQDIRPVGSDITKGELILSKGDCISSVELGLLAATNHTCIPVYKKPRVGVLSTGNELVEAGDTTRPGAIRDSNRIVLISLLQQSKFQAIDLGIVSDEPSKLLNRLELGLRNCDVILSTGGVSMGERDYLKTVITQDLGATVHFGRVNMKPGKPTTFATCTWNNTKKVLFCLPGNPVSATVTFQLFVLPALRNMAGYLPIQQFPHIITTRLGFEITKLDPRPEYRRVVLDWNQQDGIPLAKSTGDQISSRLMSWREANGLLIVPSSLEQKAPIPSGTLMKAYLISRV